MLVDRLELTALSAIQALSLSFVLYVATSWLSRRIATPLAPFATLGGLVVGSMVSFWAVFLLPATAHLVTVAFWIAVLLSVYYALRSERDDEAAIASALWCTSTIALLLWAFLPTGTGHMVEIARTRWSHPLPPDNVLPLALAKDLIAGHIPRPFFGDWFSSDRPPLQTGLFLLIRMPGNIQRSYEIAAVAAQMLIVPASYWLARSVNVSRPASIGAAVMVFFAPITLINGIFVWPKLLTAAFLSGAAAIHFTPLYEKLKGSRLAGSVVGALAAGGVLAHGAGWFTIIAFVIAACLSFRLGTLRYTAAAIITAAMLYSPWVAYQKFYDPNEGRLIRWHLAGIKSAHDPRSPMEAIEDAYSGMTMREWLGRLQEKARTTSLATFDAYRWAANDKQIRSSMFFRPIPAMGFFGLPAVILLIGSFFVRNLRLLGAVVAFNYFIWIAFVYEPSGTVVHQSSYFMLTAAMVVAASIVSRWPYVLAATAIAQAATAAVFFL